MWNVQLIVVIIGFGDNMKLKNLKSARETAGYQQKEVAALLKVTPQAYSAYELGKRQPDYATLIEIAKLLNVTTDYLLGLSDGVESSTNLPSEKEQQEKLSVVEKALIRNFRNSDTEGKEAILGRALLVSSNPDSTNGAEGLEVSPELTNTPLPLRN